MYRFKPDTFSYADTYISKLSIIPGFEEEIKEVKSSIASGENIYDDYLFVFNEVEKDLNDIKLEIDKIKLEINGGEFYDLELLDNINFNNDKFYNLEKLKKRLGSVRARFNVTRSNCIGRAWTKTANEAYELFNRYPNYAAILRNFDTS